MKIKEILIWVAVVLALFSLVSIEWGILSNKLLRIFTSGIFFLLAIKIIGLKKLWGLLIFCSLVVCDLFLLEWEAEFAKHGYYSLHSLIILVLMLATIRGMERVRVSWFEIGSAVLFLIFSSLIFLAFTEYFTIGDMSLKILFTINGILMVLLVVLAFFNSIGNSDLLASSYFIAILCLMVSEMMLFAIYFLDLPELRYIDNFFYVISLFLLLKVSLENKLMKESKLVLEEEEKKKEGEKVKESERSDVYR